MIPNTILSIDYELSLNCKKYSTSIKQIFCLSIIMYDI